MEINIPGGQQSQCEKGGKYTEPETVCKIPDSFSRKKHTNIKEQNWRNWDLKDGCDENILPAL